MPDPNDLTNISDLKAWLPVSGTGDDALLSALITGASYWFLQRINRPSLNLATYTEHRCGNDSRIMLMRNWPVQAVSSVTVSGVSIPASPDGVQAGFVFDDVSVFLVGGTAASAPWAGDYRFVRGFQNVAITYSAGYAVVPMEVQQAVKTVCAAWYKRRGWIDQASKSIQGEVIAFRREAIPPEAEAVAQMYMRRIPA